MVTITTTNGNTYSLDERRGRIRCDDGVPGALNASDEWLRLGEYREPTVGEKFRFEARMTLVFTGETRMRRIETACVESIEPLSV